MEKVLILNMPHYQKQRIRVGDGFPVGSLDEIRAAMPAYRFRVTKEWANNVTEVEVTKHRKRVTKSGRQVCCQWCHECGAKLREVLDGELWCDTCQGYK